MNKNENNEAQVEFDVEKYKEMLKGVKSMKDITGKDGLIQTLLKTTIENVMKAELEDHLGYSHNDARKKDT
jgi:putative transposase